MPRTPTVEERLAAEIATLRASGRLPSEIARACGISRQTLWRLTVGDCRRLSWHVGDRIERGIEKLRGE